MPVNPNTNHVPDSALTDLIHAELSEARAVLDGFLAEPAHLARIAEAAEVFATSLRHDGKALTCGNGGSLYCLRLTANRLNVDVSADSRLTDRVADNTAKFGGTESETIKIGQGFGTTPSIEQGLDGNLYVVSITDNTIYRISRRP